MSAISFVMMPNSEHFSKTTLKSVCKQDIAAKADIISYSNFSKVDTLLEILFRSKASTVDIGRLFTSSDTNKGHGAPTSLNLFKVS